MSDVFAPMSPATRAAQLSAYLRHLQARNGAPDLATERLPRREERLAALTGGDVKWEGDVPAAALARLMRPGAKPGPDEPEAALWMAIAAQVNVGEEFGVRTILERHPITGDPNADPYVYIELEELSHTRMLLDAVRLFGVEVELPAPRASLRFFLSLVALLPRAIGNMLVLAAECNGILLFLKLREKAATLFGTDNDVGRRVQGLLGEILIDELGHVAYLRATLGPVRLWLAGVLSRIVAPGLYATVPANARLFDLRALVREVHALSWERMPADVRARAFNPWGDHGAETGGVAAW